MIDRVFRLGLITEVFPDPADQPRLIELLRQARDQGAELAVLPELPLNGWAPGTRTPRAEDAEPPGGPRQQRLADAAREVGIGVLGGVILVDTDSGTRHNEAVLIDSAGVDLGRYRKIHLPEEEGYWETSHYEPGTEWPRVIDGLGLRVGLQLCSDVNRPQGVQLLASQGAEVILAPRATPPSTYERWRVVLRANAVMSGAYLVSVNRPRPEPGASIGGPSIAIAPSGEVIAETSDPVQVVELRREVVEKAAREYPGYLQRFPELYATAWERLRRT